MHSRIHIPRFYLVSTLFIITLLLVACGTADIEMTVYANERYDLSMEMYVPADLLALSDGPEALEAQLDEMVTDAKSAGGRAGWKAISRNTSDTYAYKLWIKGQPISNDDFKWEEIDYDGRRAYRFTISEPMTFESFTFTLNAGKILDSNGTQQGQNTVTWQDYSGVMYAVLKPKTRFFPTGYIVIGSILLIGVALFFGYGQVEGLQRVLRAGLSGGKWRMQSLKLGNDHKRLLKKKDKALTALGEKAWELKLHHNNYAQTFAQLQAIDMQQQNLEQALKVLSENIQVQTTTLNESRATFNTRIKAVEDQKKTAAASLKKLKSTAKGVDKDMRAAEKQQQKTTNEIRAMQRRVEQLHASPPEEEDTETQLETLRNGIATLKTAQNEAEQHISAQKAQITQLEQQQHPVENEIKAQEQEIARLEQEQKDTLDPITENINTLKAQAKETDEQLKALGTEMPPLLTQLGAQVNTTRPNAADLDVLYRQADAAEAELANQASQLDLVNARLASIEGSSLRRFYILVAYGVLSIGAIVGLVVLFM